MNRFRYIDKKILCSYDLSEAFFNKLGVEVYDIIPLRKVFILFTNKGKKILKSIYLSFCLIIFKILSINLILSLDELILFNIFFPLFVNKTKTFLNGIIS